MPHYTIISDGWCRGNPGPSGGSYLLETSDGRREMVRLQFGLGTNNQAEYRVVIAALEDLLGRIQREGKEPSRYSVLVKTDSRLVVGQVSQGWRVKEPSLRPLVQRVQELAARFAEVEFEWVPREEIVVVLGH
jgi:probable phosphoglycerate mutase